MSSRSNSTILDSRPRRRLRLRWTLLAAVLAWNCGPVARREEVITVTGDGAYNQTVDNDYGCDGELLRRQVHRGFGAGTAVRYETAGGGLFGARFRGMAAEVTSTRIFGDENVAASSTKDGPGYGLLALGVDGGWDWKYYGFSLGVSAVVGTDFQSALTVPYSQVRLGDLSTLWFETTAGTDDPLFYFNLVSMGAGMRLPAGFRARAGLSLHGKVIRDALGNNDTHSQGDLKYGVGADAATDIGGYLEVRYVPPGGGLGFDVGVLGAAEPAVRVGATYAFPVK